MRKSRVIIVVVLLGLSCRSERWDVPDDAYRLFSGALKKGDAATAWDSLSPATQKLLSDRSKAIAAASKGAIKDDPKVLTLASGVKVQPIGEVKVLKLEGAVAVLEVTEGGIKREQKMVKEGDRWRVDLTEAIGPGPAQ